MGCKNKESWGWFLKFYNTKDEIIRLVIDRDFGGGDLAKFSLFFGLHMAPLYGVGVAELQPPNLGLYSIKFYWFDYDSIKYQIFTDFL